MSLLILALVVILVVALVVRAVSMLPIPQPVNGVLQALVVIIGAVVILARSGLLGG